MQRASAVAWLRLPRRPGVDCGRRHSWILGLHGRVYCTRKRISVLFRPPSGMCSRWMPPCARTGEFSGATLTLTRENELRGGEHTYSLWFQARGTATRNYSGRGLDALPFTPTTTHYGAWSILRAKGCQYASRRPLPRTLLYPRDPTGGGRCCVVRPPLWSRRIREADRGGEEYSQNLTSSPPSLGRFSRRDQTGSAGLPTERLRADEGNYGTTRSALR